MPAPDGNPLLSRRYKAWLVGALFALGALNYADRAILAVLAQPIKEDLLLTDAQIGMLQGLGFAILYSVLGLPLGWLAERVNRKAMLAICVAIWSPLLITASTDTLLVCSLASASGTTFSRPPLSTMANPRPRSAVM